MTLPVEFVCRDCGTAVFSHHTVPGAGTSRCVTCEWVAALATPLERAYLHDLLVSEPPEARETR